ncbi:MAG: TRAP transporter small permease [Pseudomonadota bacterium]|nr:TRAP transporter small permease [Pseudomonadota bacterium]
MSHVLNLLDRILSVVEKAILSVAVALFAFMLIANVVNIVSRYVLGTAIDWVFPWSGLIFVWISFLGFFVYFRRGQDVVVDLLVRRFNAPVRILLAVVGYAVVIGMAGLIFSTIFRIIDGQRDAIQMVGLPRYSMAVPLFLSCFFIVVECLSRIGGMLTGALVPFEDDQTAAPDDPDVPAALQETVNP